MPERNLFSISGTKVYFLLVTLILSVVSIQIGCSNLGQSRVDRDLIRLPAKKTIADREEADQSNSDESMRRIAGGRASSFSEPGSDMESSIRNMTRDRSANNPMGLPEWSPENRSMLESLESKIADETSEKTGYQTQMTTFTDQAITDEACDHHGGCDCHKDRILPRLAVVQPMKAPNNAALISRSIEKKVTVDQKPDTTTTPSLPVLPQPVTAIASPMVSMARPAGYQTLAPIVVADLNLDSETDAMITPAPTAGSPSDSRLIPDSKFVPESPMDHETNQEADHETNQEADQPAIPNVQLIPTQFSADETGVTPSSATETSTEGKESNENQGIDDESNPVESESLDALRNAAWQVHMDALTARVRNSQPTNEPNRLPNFEPKQRFVAAPASIQIPSDTADENEPSPVKVVNFEKAIGPDALDSSPPIPTLETISPTPEIKPSFPAAAPIFNPAPTSSFGPTTPESTSGTVPPVKAESAAETTTTARESLQLSHPSFCTEVSGFGQFKRFASTTFRSHQPLLIYCEIENQHSEQRPSESEPQFETRLQGRCTIYNAVNESVKLIRYPVVEDIAERRRRDFYMYFPVELPELPAGDYRMELRVDDLGNQQAASITHGLEFSVD